jgi:colanic acid biosynthesis glycosyl transferase WcaI
VTGRSPVIFEDNAPVKILVYGLNFHPELTGIGKYTGEMVDWLRCRGHEVRVVTAPPYYPQWKVQEPYSAWKCQREGDVIRCPLWVPRRLTFLSRVVHLMSFSVSSLPAMLMQARWRPDVVWTVAPSLLSAPVAILTARLSRAPCWLHIQDFEVEAAFQLKLSSSRGILRILEWFERHVLRGFDRVSTISPGMLEVLRKKLGRSEGTVLLSNWVDTSEIHSGPASAEFRASLGIPPEATVALYSGSLAAKQGLELLIDAARLTGETANVHFVICGSGPMRESLQQMARELPNVCFLPLQPVDRLPELLRMADIHLLPQRAGIASTVMPSKHLAIMASGRPTVYCAEEDSSLAQVFAGSGLRVEPGDSIGFSQSVTQLAGDPQLRAALGAVARRYAIANLDRESILSGFERELFATASQHPGTAPSESRHSTS